MGMQPAAMPTTMEMTIWKNFMTMPTTAMGIWAYCACPNTGSRAPYFRSILLMAAMAATRLIWERKLVMPSVSIREQSLPWSGRSRRPGWIIFIRRQIPDGQSCRDHLPYYGGHRCPHHAPAADEDEDGVQKDIHHRSGQRGYHGEAGSCRRPG